MAAGCRPRVGPVSTPATPSLHGLSDGDCSSATAATSTFFFFLKNVIPVTLISCRWWNLYSSPFEMEVDWCHNKNYFNCFLPGLSHTPLRLFSGACFSPWGSLCELWVGKTIMKLFPGPQIVTGFILLSPSFKVPLFLFCFVSFPFFSLWSRGSVLEPEGTVEIKFRRKDLVKTMRRVDPVYIHLAERLGMSACPPGKSMSRSADL